MPLALPASLPIETLRATHPEYDADALADFRALYEAGKSFRARLDRFLVKRQIERTADPSAADHYRYRKERAWYIPHGAGVQDWLVAAALRDPLRCEPGEDFSGDTDYWTKLNENADGLGATLGSKQADALLALLICGRAGFGIVFDSAVGTAAAHSKDARLTTIPGDLIDDWQTDSRGAYEWVRLHRRELTRPSAYAPATVAVDEWVYLTPSEVVTFRLDDPHAKVVLGTHRPHDLGVLPFIPIRSRIKTHVMARLHDALVALYNREVSATVYLDALAYPLLILSLLKEGGSDMAKVVDAMLAALKLYAGETANYVSPAPTGYEQLAADIVRLKNALYEVIQALSVNAAATQTQNARQAATAKLMDRDPLQTLLLSFADPIKEALRTWVETVEKYRGETGRIDLKGLENLQATMPDLAAVLGLPGRRWGEAQTAEDAAKATEQAIERARSDPEHQGPFGGTPNRVAYSGGEG